ncbi:MAG: nuclear transport factor 2 family protein [Bilifractor sp.]|jgi:hypothetical protein
MDIEKEIIKIKSYIEIENLMSRYMHYHSCFRDDLILSQLWAMDREDITLEDGASGVFKGSEHIRAYYTGRPNPPGKFIFHSIHTPVIEIADDCMTAKGVWMLSGVESGMVPDDVKNLPEDMFCKNKVDGKRVWAHWCWSKYGIDFINEDGKWKIWHFHCYALTRTPFDTNWVEFAAKQTLARHGKPTDPNAPKLKFIGDNGIPVFFPQPDEPTTFHWDYDGLTSRVVLQPVPPEPYDTFENTFKY